MTALGISIISTFCCVPLQLPLACINDRHSCEQAGDCGEERSTALGERGVSQLRALSLTGFMLILLCSMVTESTKLYVSKTTAKTVQLYSLMGRDN